MEEIVYLQPDDVNFLQAIRHTGYNFNTALSDIIDNSIAAEANDINIIADPDGTIAIIDNGIGMSPSTLSEAMRLGSSDLNAERKPTDLGRFGLGLKMASVSMCSKTTVVSKTSTQECSLTLDLDFMKKQKESGHPGWGFIRPDINLVPYSNEIGSQGTLVLWENLGTALQLPTREHPDYSKSFNELISDAKTHIGVVYHRFITGSNQIPKCSIKVNNDPIEPFDPFVPDLSVPNPIEPAEFQGIYFQAFTLPHPKAVNSEDWVKYGGRDGYYNNQGLYVYRANRLIIAGNWLNLAPRKELTKLCRIKVDLPNTVKSDTDWNLTVDKADVKIPLAFRRRLRAMIQSDNLTGNSKKSMSGRKGNRVTQVAQLPLWIPSANHGNLLFSINTDHPIIDMCIDNNDTQSLIRFVENNLPMLELYTNYAEHPDNKDHLNTGDENYVKEIAMSMIQFCKDENINDVEKELRTLPLLDLNWEWVRPLIEKD